MAEVEVITPERQQAIERLIGSAGAQRAIAREAFFNQTFIEGPRASETPILDEVVKRVIDSLDVAFPASNEDEHSSEIDVLEDHVKDRLVEIGAPDQEVRIRKGGSIEGRKSGIARVQEKISKIPFDTADTVLKAVLDKMAPKPQPTLSPQARR